MQRLTGRIKIASGRVVRFVLLALALACLAPQTPAHAAVDNFEFKSLDVVYQLSKDDAGRSQLLVTETFVAKFPDFNQNRGIVRQIPTKYRGRPLKFELISVERDGLAASVRDKKTEYAVFSMQIRDDNYVHGEHTYVIKYRMRDVIVDPLDANIQEFYWDVNGIGWSQPFGSVTARIELEGELANNLSGDLACYTGVANSKERNCSIKQDGTGIFVATSQPLAKKENLTFGVGFKPDTFTQYQPSRMAELAILFASGVIAGGILTAIYGLKKWLEWKNQLPKSKGSAPTQYLPPDGFDPAMAGVFAKADSSKSALATVIDLAIKKDLTLIEVDPSKKGIFSSKKKSHKILINRVGKWSLAQKGALGVFFGDDLRVGAEYIINPDKQDEKAGRRLDSFMDYVKVTLMGQGFFMDKSEDQKKWSSIFLAGAFATPLLAMGGLFLLNQIGGIRGDISFLINNWFLKSGIPILSSLSLDAVSAMAIVLLVAALVAGLSMKLKVFYSQSGVDAKDHLEGLKTYLSLAEADRIQFLQGLETADRQAVNDNQQKIVLYERVLPYAILFGLEKSWFKLMDQIYSDADVTPLWYAASSGLSASDLSSVLSSLSSATASSISASSGYSGSGGGGFSGGGGGGGGGGGC